MGVVRSVEISGTALPSFPARMDRANDYTAWFKYVPTDHGKGNKIMLLEFYVDVFLLSAHPSCSVARDEFRKAFMERFDAKD